MIRKIHTLSIFSACLFSISFSSISMAGPLYRFPDDEGVPTLSRSLPPEAAQRGYDVLDDKTMRLLEHVPPAPTAEEIVEMEKQAAIEAEQQRLAEKKRKEQAIIDRTLLTTYESESDLIEARDTDLLYRQSQIDTHHAKLPELESYLVKLQQEAADQELSGKKITENMQKRLDAAQEEIDIRLQAISQLQSELNDLTESYEKDLNRLRELKSIKP